MICNWLRQILLFFLFHVYCISGWAQHYEIPELRSAQLEDLAEKKDIEPQDDSYALELEQFRIHPLNLNTASEEDLVKLQIPDIIQIRNLIQYRKLLGFLLTEHELQAVPGWDIETIRRLLPYIRIGRDESVYSALKERWKGGDASFLIRTSQVIEKSKGFEKPANPDASHYMGSAERIFIRYLYNYKQILAYGFTGDKDAGEPFFRGAQRLGFDFYSFHFFLRHTGIIKALALGDFTVNLGQGLIQWQNIAFSKGSQALGVKREASCINPYHSAGEFNYHRGAAISLEKGNWESSFFISLQKISTNPLADTSGQENLFSSFQNSGYHRTATEIANRNNSEQFSMGGNIRITKPGFMVGMNYIEYHFSRSFNKKPVPYNLFSIKGNELRDLSMDYHYTISNLHAFGEIATDQHKHIAIIQGALVSLNENLDLSFLYRNISARYQSLYSDAFTENSTPVNEKGFYTGFSYRPVQGLQADLFYDVYHFPWLKYRVDGPAAGMDFSVQLKYNPDKTWQLISLYRNEYKTMNGDAVHPGTHPLINILKKRWRLSTVYNISRAIGFTSRTEFIWTDSKGLNQQRGFLGMAGMRMSRNHTDANFAILFFETDGYDVRVYTYEADVLYNYTLPAYYGKGIHYYINVHQELSGLLNKSESHLKLSGWLRWGQTFYPGYKSIGSGLDEIPGSRKSEWKVQVIVQWQ